MQKVIVDIQITEDQYLAYYEGAVKLVHCYARDGRSVQFPAGILRPYITHTGIQGSFAIYFDSKGKLVKIEQI